MTKAIIYFKQLIQDSQDFGSDDEHMVSRVFFDLEVGGKIFKNLYTNVKQPVGATFETTPLEVSQPVGYAGPLNYGTFRQLIEEYFRGLVGAQGKGIRIDGASNIRMQNNIFVQKKVVEFEVETSGTGW